MSETFTAQHQPRLAFTAVKPVLLSKIYFYCLGLWFTSITRVLTQGQKDNVLPFIRPELLNTIMGVRTVLKCPNKVHQRVQRELAVILTC